MHTVVVVGVRVAALLPIGLLSGCGNGGGLAHPENCLEDPFPAFSGPNSATPERGASFITGAYCYHCDGEVCPDEGDTLDWNLHIYFATYACPGMEGEWMNIRYDYAADTEHPCCDDGHQYVPQECSSWYQVPQP